MLEDVLKKVDEIKAKLAERGYEPFNFTVIVDELKNGRAGQANTYYNQIAISKHYLQEHTERVLNITVPHEVCHLYVRKYAPRAKQAHGREFRYFMNLLGLEGKTYHDMQLKEAAHKNKQRKTKVRWVYESENTKQQYLLTTTQHNKMQVNPRAFYVTKTRESLKFTGTKKEIK
jgi:predicted SprT family Zn-dependent metalloprotease